MYDLKEIPVTEAMESAFGIKPQIAAYWSSVLEKRVIDAYQASKRGGYLHCELLEKGRIAISGEAVLVAVSDIKVSI